jgi:hypothetical protein
MAFAGVDMTTSAQVPRGLSAGSADIWKALTTQLSFERRELYVFERALRWWDQSDQWLRDSEKAAGRDQARLVKQSMDAASAALRLWRSLKFTDGPASRRPGRPSGADWSPQRKAAALKAV